MAQHLEIYFYNTSYWLKEKIYTNNSVDEEKALLKIKYTEVFQKWERKISEV